MIYDHENEFWKKSTLIWLTLIKCRCAYGGYLESNAAKLNNVCQTYSATAVERETSLTSAQVILIFDNQISKRQHNVRIMDNVLRQLDMNLIIPQLPS